MQIMKDVSPNSPLDEAAATGQRNFEDFQVGAEKISGCSPRIRQFTLRRNPIKFWQKKADKVDPPGKELR